MKSGHLLFSLLCCIPMSVYAQEGLKKDSIRLSMDSLKAFLTSHTCFLIFPFQKRKG